MENVNSLCEYIYIPALHPSPVGRFARCISKKIHVKKLVVVDAIVIDVYIL